jgi:hypothetical protein
LSFRIRIVGTERDRTLFELVRRTSESSSVGRVFSTSLALAIALAEDLPQLGEIHLELSSAVREGSSVIGYCRVGALAKSDQFFVGVPDGIRTRVIAVKGVP